MHEQLSWCGCPCRQPKAAQMYVWTVRLQCSELLVLLLLYTVRATGQQSRKFSSDFLEGSACTDRLKLISHN